MVPRAAQCLLNPDHGRQQDVDFPGFDLLNRPNVQIHQLGQVASAVDANGNPLQSVQFYADGAPIGQSVTPVTRARLGGPETRGQSSGGAFAQLVYQLQNAVQLITAQGVDGNGVSAVSDGATVFTKAAGNVLTCAIESPAANAVLPANSAGGTVSVAASDSGGQLGGVVLFVDNQSVATLTAPPYNFTLPALTPGTHTLFATATDMSSGVSQQSSPVTVTATTGAIHPAFFTGEANLGSNNYYLVFPNGTLFGYYNYTFFPFLYHFDLGFEYFIDANNTQHGAFLYDFTLNTFFYTDPTLFPYLYNFNANAFYYYFLNSNSPGRYTSNPRVFVNLTTNQFIYQ